MKTKKRFLTSLLTLLLIPVIPVKTFELELESAAYAGMAGATGLVIGAITYAAIKKFTNNNPKDTHKTFFSRYKKELASAVVGIISALGIYATASKWYLKNPNDLAALKKSFSEQVIDIRTAEIDNDYAKNKVISADDLNNATKKIRALQDNLLQKTISSATIAQLKDQFDKEFEPYYTNLKQERARLNKEEAARLQQEEQNRTNQEQLLQQKVEELQRNDQTEIAVIKDIMAQALHRFTTVQDNAKDDTQKNNARRALQLLNLSFNEINEHMNTALNQEKYITYDIFHTDKNGNAIKNARSPLNRDWARESIRTVIEAAEKCIRNN